MIQANKPKYLSHIVLVAGAIIMVFPFIWTILTSFKTMAETIAIPLVIFPSSFDLTNYKDALTNLPFLTFFRNTLIVAITKAIGQLAFCSLAAYAFARIKFPGRNVIFILYLSVLMIPYQIFIIPQYLIMMDLGWLNSIKALIVPGLFSAFGTFLLRQFFMTLPKEIEEAATIDGCNHFRIYSQIMMPMVVPGLIAVCIFTVLSSWNDLLWPLIVNNSPEKLTLAAGLAFLRGEHSTNYPVLMAGSLMAILPMILMFIFLQKYFIEGIAITGVKG